MELTEMGAVNVRIPHNEIVQGDFLPGFVGEHRVYAFVLGFFSGS